MAATPALKAVFFDMDDTLVLTSEADSKSCARVGDLAVDLVPGIRRQQLLDDWRVRFLAAPWDTEMQVPVPEWRAGHWAAAMRAQGVEAPEVASKLQECFDTTRIELFRFEPGVKELVASLRAGGRKAVIITNGHAGIQRTKLVACGAADLFDGILVGGEEVLAGRAEKPDAGIFRAACAIARCEPSEACHIGDSLTTDVAGGHNARLRATIWVNRTDASLPTTAAQPTFIVRHVADLGALLPEIEALRPPSR